MFAARAEQPHRRRGQRGAQRRQVGPVPLVVYTRQQRRTLGRGGADGVHAVAQRRQRLLQPLQQ